MKKSTSVMERLENGKEVKVAQLFNGLNTKTVFKLLKDLIINKNGKVVGASEEEISRFEKDVKKYEIYFYEDVRDFIDEFLLENTDSYIEVEHLRMNDYFYGFLEDHSEKVYCDCEEECDCDVELIHNFSDADLEILEEAHWIVTKLNYNDAYFKNFKKDDCNHLSYDLFLRLEDGPWGWGGEEIEERELEEIFKKHFNLKIKKIK